MTNPDDNRVREIARQEARHASSVLDCILFIGIFGTLLLIGLAATQLKDAQRRIGVLEQQVKELQQR